MIMRYIVIVLIFTIFTSCSDDDVKEVSISVDVEGSDCVSHTEDLITLCGQDAEAFIVTVSINRPVYLISMIERYEREDVTFERPHVHDDGKLSYQFDYDIHRLDDYYGDFLYGKITIHYWESEDVEDDDVVTRVINVEVE